MAYAITVVNGLRHEGSCAQVLLDKACSCRKPFPIAWEQEPEPEPIDESRAETARLLRSLRALRDLARKGSDTPGILSSSVSFQAGIALGYHLAAKHVSTLARNDRRSREYRLTVA